MTQDALSLGEPPRDDVHAAAELWLRYESEAPLSSSGATMFLRCLRRPAEVFELVEQLRSQR